MVAALELRDEPSLGSTPRRSTRSTRPSRSTRRPTTSASRPSRRASRPRRWTPSLAKMDEHMNGPSEQKSRLESLEAKLARARALTGGRPVDGESNEEAGVPQRLPSTGCGAGRPRAATEGHPGSEGAGGKDGRRRARDARHADGGGRQYAAAGAHARPRSSRAPSLACPSTSCRSARSPRCARWARPTTTSCSTSTGPGSSGSASDTRNQTNTPDLAEIVPTSAWPAPSRRRRRNRSTTCSSTWKAG